jgi:dTDP-4-amino-4,6-dideoxy-D-glucose acyltransferase
MAFYTKKDLRELGFDSLGENVLVSQKASIYGAERIALGSNVRIDDFCVLSAGDGGIRLGQNVHVGISCLLLGSGKIEMEDFSGLSSRVSIYSSSDDYSGDYMTNPTVPEKYTNVDTRDVKLGRHVIVGSGSVILPGVTIGENTAVGALALIVKNLAADSVYAGRPAKRIKARSRELFELEREYLGTNAFHLNSND